MAGEFKVNITDSLKKMEKSLEDIAPQVENELNQAIRDVAHSAYANIIAKAQKELGSTRQDYLKGVQFMELENNTYLITLEGSWPQKLEDGFAPYNLTDVLLKSKKIVEVGRRSGMPWVQESKEGKKFAYVPLQRQPFTKREGKMGDMAEDIRKMTAQNSKGRKQKLTSIFKDSEGNPLEGKVAIGRSENPLVDGLVKYQKNYVNDKGKVTTQSVYINYRAVSEAGEAWQHPGFKGLHAFEDTEKMVVEQINQILRTLL